MKRLFSKAKAAKALVAALCLSVFLAGCDKPVPVPTPSTPGIEIRLGKVTDSEIYISLAAQNADKLAYQILEAEAEAPSAKTIFEEGEVSDASEKPEAYTISGLAPESAYIIYAASFKEGVYSEVAYVEATTKEAGSIEEPELLISDLEPSGMDVSYNINVPEGEIVYHAYLEWWAFGELLYDAIAAAGGEDNFDYNSFVYNLLADTGVACSESGTYTWSAGTQHPIRRVVDLTPGKDYVILSARFVNDNWTGDVCVMPFTMPEPAGESSVDITVSADDVQYNYVVIRMECNEYEVAFFYYDIFKKDQYDNYIAEKGLDGMKNYLFEYHGSNVSGNTYTDKWETDSDTDWVIAVYGFDYYGGEIFKEFEVHTPKPTPEIKLYANPYQREIIGYNDYDSFHMQFTTRNFSGKLDTDRLWCSTVPMERSTFDEWMNMLELGGKEFDELEHALANPDLFSSFILGNMSALNLSPVSDAEEIKTLKEQNYFDRIYYGLNPDTEYVFIAACYVGETPVVGLTSAETEAVPDSSEPCPAYNSFLGYWDVLGQTTEDWSSYVTRKFRIEALTANHSFKVYGWGESVLSEDFPFEIQYLPDSQEIVIHTPQFLGRAVLQDENGQEREFDVVFVSKLQNADNLYPFMRYTGPAYWGRLDGDHLSMFAQGLTVDGRQLEFTAMNYILYDGENYYITPDTKFDLVNFRINRGTAPDTGTKTAYKKGISTCRPIFTKR